MPKAPNAYLTAIADARRRLVYANNELEVAKANVKVCKASLDLAVLNGAIEADRQLGLPLDELNEARARAEKKAAGE